MDVIGSIYSHYLGSVTPLDAADFDSTLYLGVVVGNFELTPRTELSYSPYAFSVAVAQTVVCSGAVGDVKYSILNPTQFAAENGACWVPMDGRSIAGSKLAGITGLSTLPDGGGLFIRSQEFSGGANNDPSRTFNSPIATFQGEAVQAHTHDVAIPPHSHTYIRQNVEVYKNGFLINTGNNDILLDKGAPTENTSEDPGEIVTSGGSSGPETRPKNLNFWIYIRIN